MDSLGNICDRQIVALILAAGSSSRMGQPKALLPWGRTTVIGHIHQEIRAAGIEDVVLVTGAHHTNLEKVTESLEVNVCYNPQWETGMGSSLSTGVSHVEKEYPGAAAILVLLSDQPLITAGFLTQVLESYHAYPQNIIASDYGENTGVPVLFPRSFWSALKDLPPRRGAKYFLRNRPNQIVALDPGHAITDIDTPAAYRKALELAGYEKK